MVFGDLGKTVKSLQIKRVIRGKGIELYGNDLSKFKIEPSNTPTLLYQ
jgi:hypothetical protein